LAVDGSLCGTTLEGGASGFGTIFQVPTNGGLTILASLDNRSGIRTFAGLIQGNDGNLYGTMGSGGAGSAGTILRLNLAAGLMFLSETKSGTLFNLVWSTKVGKSYQLQSSTSLTRSFHLGEAGAFCGGVCG